MLAAIRSTYPQTAHIRPHETRKSHFTYMGQAVLRGEPYYQTTFMGYPPVGALLAAASMYLGGWFDLPTYVLARIVEEEPAVVAMKGPYRCRGRITHLLVNRGWEWTDIELGGTLEVYRLPSGLD